MTSANVYKGVRIFNSNHDHKFENVFVHDWEADLFSVTSSGYTYEIEVKISRSDFFADFKKTKHHFFKSYKTGYGIMNLGETWICEGWPMTKQFPELKDFEIRKTNISPRAFTYRSCPNKFMYACPVGLIESHEIPDYAGLIYIMDSGQPRVIKKAPFLHKDPINIKEMLFNKYYNLVLTQKEEIRGLKWQVDHFKGKLEEQTQKLTQ